MISGTFVRVAAVTSTDRALECATKTACTAGTMTWGEQNTEAEAHEQLDYYFECGINTLDTAEMYPVPPKQATQGATDRYIATWLKKTNVKREDIVLATKVSGYSKDRAYVRPDADTCRVNPAQIRESVDASLARLGVDHIDLLQIHWSVVDG